MQKPELSHTKNLNRLNSRGNKYSHKILHLKYNYDRLIFFIEVHKNLL